MVIPSLLLNIMLFTKGLSQSLIGVSLCGTQSEDSATFVNFKVGSAVRLVKVSNLVVRGAKVSSSVEGYSTMVISPLLLTLVLFAVGSRHSLV